jgi:hypothetical protein
MVCFDKTRWIYYLGINLVNRQAQYGTLKGTGQIWTLLAGVYFYSRKILGDCLKACRKLFDDWGGNSTRYLRCIVWRTSNSWHGRQNNGIYTSQFIFSIAPIKSWTTAVKRAHPLFAGPYVNPKPHLLVLHLTVRLSRCYFLWRYLTSDLHIGASSVSVRYLRKKWLCTESRKFQCKNQECAASYGRRKLLMHSYTRQDRLVLSEKESSQNAEWSLKIKWIRYTLGLSIPHGNPLTRLRRETGGLKFQVCSIFEKVRG